MADTKLIEKAILANLVPHLEKKVINIEARFIKSL